MDEYDDEEIIEQRQKEQERLDRNLELFLLNAMNDEGGRAFMFNLLNITGCLAGSTFQSDPRVQAFIEGRRSVGAEIYRQLAEYVPKEFFGELIRVQVEKKHAKKRGDE